jgi:hypothetical protein
VHRINPKIKYASQADLITMDLKEFINKTLTQIAEGVQGAIDASSGGSYLVNPSASKIGADCKVHFELSVESGKKGEASIKVLGGEMSERSVNRISFDIIMTLPTSGNATKTDRPAYE